MKNQIFKGYNVVMNKLLVLCVSFLAVVGYAEEKENTKGLQDLSADATYKIFDEGPSGWNVDKAFLLKDGERTGTYKDGFAFHTGNPDMPGYIIVELKNKAAIKKLNIMNRAGLEEAAASLAIWVSQDQKEWQEIWAAEKAELNWEIVLDKEVETKFIKIGLKKPGYLHLNKVRIYGKYQ
jgi:hypothetical protein